MAYLATLTAEISALVEAACPEVQHVWPAEVLMRIPLEDLANGGKIPFVVVHYLGFTAAEWALQNFAYEAEVELLYVRRIPEDLDGLVGRLEALRDAFQEELKAPTLTAGQVREVGSLSWSAFSPSNMRFISKLLPFVSGSLTLTVLTGELS